MYRFNLGYALWKKGDFAAAAESFRALLDLDPTILPRPCCWRVVSKNRARAPARIPDLNNLERLKTNFEERAYMQLKSLLAPEA